MIKKTCSSLATGYSGLQCHKLVLATLCIIAFGGLSATPAQAGWEVTWIDPFDGPGVDWNNWTAQTEANYNAEVQCYTADDSSANKNYDVSGGTLTIIARRQLIDCPSPALGTRQWSSGRLNSKDKQEFLYGRLEARIRVLDTLGGSWPAFWMLENQIAEQPIKGDGDNIGWPNPGAGEIDVWEWFSNNPGTYITNFYNQSSGCIRGDVATYPYSAAIQVTDWQTYAIEWDANVARFYINDTLWRTRDLSACGQYEEPMFVLLNVAMGGMLGGNIDVNLTQARMEVDYVAHCQPTNGNSETRCNESTPGLTQDLLIFAETERAEWVAWDSSGGTNPAPVADNEPSYGQVMQFNVAVANTVLGFTARPPAVGGTPFDASGIAITGTLEFDLKMTAEPAGGPTDWKLKVESPAAATEVEVSLTTSQEGHPAPVLDTWQHYSFKLSDLEALGLDISAIDTILVYPTWGTGNGAAYRLDNVEILPNVAQNPGTPDNTANDTGTSSDGGGSSSSGSVGLWLILALGGLSMVRRVRKNQRDQ